MTRALFFIVCVIAGVAAGWWWTVQSYPDLPGDLPDSTSENREQSYATNIATRPEATFNKTATQPMVTSYHDGIMKVAPAVVSLYAASSQNSSSPITTSQGSGVIVKSDGVVLTNLHLIDGLDLITVVLNDGRSFPAQLIGSDKETDLAVVRIDVANLPYLPLDEADPLRVGDVVLAIGNPFGVGQTVTQGIVSATRRRVAGASVWQNFVQIDAAINPGNSGGALINPYGQLVGVNTAVFRGDSGAMGIGFSIPADLLSQVVPQIIENGSVERGWLGIGVDDPAMYQALRNQRIEGAVITDVVRDSPASRSGLKTSDVVLALGERPINNATALLLEVSALPPGATVKLSVLRNVSTTPLTDPSQTIDFDRVDLKVTLGTRPDLTAMQGLR